MTSSPPVWRVPGWDRFPGLVHGFFGRRGGHGDGQWATLNLSTVVGDDPDVVGRNWERIRESLGGLDMVAMRQVHGTGIARVDAAGHVGEADAMLTRVAGIGLAILTADCVPALIVAPAARTAIAVHAGWRGTVGGVLPAAISAAEREYGLAPSALHLALGPSIGGCCYEVESAITEEIEQAWGRLSPAAWKRTGDKGWLDLRKANTEIAARVFGIPEGQIACVGPCTACQSGDFFSHRRDRGRTGRQVSVVGWAQNDVVRP